MGRRGRQRCAKTGACPPNPVIINTSPVVMLAIDTGPPLPAAFDEFCPKPRRRGNPQARRLRFGR